MRQAVLFFLTLLIAAPAYAQYGLPNAEGALFISLDPVHPMPGQRVALSLSSSIYDLDASSIVWRANGTVIAQGAGVTTAAITAGGLGVGTNVTADVTSDAGTASAQASIIPTHIDLLWESTSYTPPFYKGRALSSTGTGITIVAMPRFDGASPESLIYTWKKDGEMLGSYSGKGKSAAALDWKTLFGASIISVEATAADGSISGEASVRIPDTPPQLTLYEDHPLYGILYFKALGPSTFIAETESSFAAVPYFAPVTSLGDRMLSYEWAVNQSGVTPDSAHPNEITINASKSSGIALIQLTLSHTKNYFFSGNGAWNVTFGANSRDQLIASDPFRAQ